MKVMEKLMANVLEVLYDPGQPRHPAGSSMGGRFAPKEGGAGGGDGSKVGDRTTSGLTGVVHERRDDGIHSTYKGFDMLNPTGEVETFEDADLGFSDGGEESLVSSANDFVGLSMHLVQQTGGKLTYKGKPVEPSTMGQASGEPIPDDAVVLFGGKEVKFGDLKK